MFCYRKICNSYEIQANTPAVDRNPLANFPLSTYLNTEERHVGK